MKIINFDHNATTPIAAEALARMNEAYLESGNSSSLHFLGRKSAMMIEDARSTLSKAVNGANYEIIFTSGGTEANNMALFAQDFAQIFYSKIEHSSVYNVRPQSVEIIEIATDKSGVINLQDLEKKLEKISTKNFLLSLMLINNETGAIQPLKEAARIVHQKGGLIHSDLVQAFGKIAIDLEDLNIDFASVSAHKISGPQGVGALLVRRGIDIKPLIFGGGHEKGKRSGTLNHAAIAGFGEAIKLIDDKILQSQNLQNLRDFIESELKNIAKNDIVIFAQDVPRAANTSLFAIRNSDNQTQLIYFDLNKIMVSNGSACSSGTINQSRVLQAMNIAPEFSGAIRVSLSLENTRVEAEKFINVFKAFYLKGSI